MTKTGNVLQVLRLFSEQRHQIRVEDIATMLEVSSATAYRYVADLERAGFVEGAAPGQYVLGPTIVELDRQIRMHDPLIGSASDILRTLSERTGGTTILARLHGRKVVCVDQVPGRHGPRSVSYLSVDAPCRSIEVRRRPRSSRNWIATRSATSP